jgi:anti-sigma regulatory factor (Ser/Thr protein kinase)
MSHQRQFPNDVSSVTDARRFALEALQPLAAPVDDAVALMVTELAANAVRHAASSFTVKVDRLEREIRVEVSDIGPGSPAVRSPEPTEPSGRGLRIVQALARAWGVVPAPPGEVGKAVWFTITLQPGADESALLTREVARSHDESDLRPIGGSVGMAPRDADDGNRGAAPLELRARSSLLASCSGR